MSAFTAMYHPDEPSAEVSTIAELDALLEQVTADATAEDVPTYVELTAPDKQRALHIGLGRPTASSLTFYDIPADTVTTSTGTTPQLTPDDEWAFDYGGTWTHAPADSAIPTDTARQAAREFLTTGQRPTNLHWQDPHY